MAYKTIHSILEDVRKHYTTIHSALDAAEIFATDADAQAAISTVREEEQRVADSLTREGDSSETGEQGLETWVQYVPDEELQAVVSRFKECCCKPHTAEELEDIKLEFDDAVTELMQAVASQVKAPSVQDRMQKLADWFATRARQDSWSLRRE